MCTGLALCHRLPLLGIQFDHGSPPTRSYRKGERMDRGRIGRRGRRARRSIDRPAGSSAGPPGRISRGSVLAIPLQPRHEFGMLGGVEPLLDDSEHGVQFVAHQGGRVEPEAGEDRAAKDAPGPGHSGR